MISLNEKLEPCIGHKIRTVPAVTVFQTQINTIAQYMRVCKVSLIADSYMYFELPNSYEQNCYIIII